MMPDKSQGGLLARLQALSCCQYLSDLHSPFYIEDIIYAVRTVSISSYSISEWEEAFRYISGIRMEFKSEEELVKNLILRLEENKKPVNQLPMPRIRRNDS